MRQDHFEIGIVRFYWAIFDISSLSAPDRTVYLIPRPYSMSMNIHQTFVHEHQTLQQQAQELESAFRHGSAQLAGLMVQFQAAVLRHLKRKDVYYARVDDGRRVPNRQLMHDLRNDQAALVLAFDCLVTRTLRSGGDGDWTKWLEIKDLLLSHFQKEEATLFPLVQVLLTSADLECLGRELSGSLCPRQAARQEPA